MINWHFEVDLVDFFLEDIAGVAVSIATRGAAVSMAD